jgi:hypothetical protein
VSNQIPPDEVDIRPLIVAALGACFKWGGSVTSWVRSPEHNLWVGGKPNSKHLQGRAVDVVWGNVWGNQLGVGPGLAELQDYMKEMAGSAVRVLREPTHDHFEI